MGHAVCRSEVTGGLPANYDIIETMVALSSSIADPVRIFSKKLLKIDFSHFQLYHNDRRRRKWSQAKNWYP